MGSESYIQLALELLGCSQKDLAVQLDVSPTQISKWKKGDYLSHEMETRLRELIGIGDQEPEFILWTGGIEAAKKWEKLIKFIASLAFESAETGYNTEPLRDESSLLCWQTIYTLIQMGVEIPQQFPKELGIYLGDPELDCRLSELHPIAGLIEEIFFSLNDVWGFYAAFISNLIYSDGINLDDPIENIEPCLLELAASKIDVDEDLAKNFKSFRYQIQANYEKWLCELKDSAFQAGIPIKAELLDLIYLDHDAVGHMAEAESLGFNKSRAHPDIYMNELLEGMRMIHRIMPAIIKKLGIENEIDWEFDA